jgi:hypothetical protein
MIYGQGQVRDVFLNLGFTSVHLCPVHMGGVFKPSSSPSPAS